MPPRSSNYRGQTDSMEVLNVDFTLPAAVAAAQNLGLLGSLVVVTIVCFLEATR